MAIFNFSILYYITSAKRWVGVIMKRQIFLLFFSIIHADVSRWVGQKNAPKQVDVKYGQVPRAKKLRILTGHII